MPNLLDFNIPKQQGSADKQGSSCVLEDSNLGAQNITNRNLFDYKVNNIAKKIKEIYCLSKKLQEVIEGAKGENKGVDIEIANAIDATKSTT